MCGIGTTVVEGAAIGRRCVGVDLEQRWVDIATANAEAILGDADQRGRAELRGLAELRTGDARDLPRVLGEHAGQVDLIATSPPYACDVAVIDKRAWDAGGSLKRVDGYNYSSARANLGHARGQDYRSQMLDVYAACFAALRPGGLLVTVTKNMRHKGRLVDLASTTVELATAVGFGYLQHNVALLCAVRGGSLVARPSFWQTTQVRHARSRGVPQHLVAHEDVCVFVRPEVASSPETAGRTEVTGA